MIVDVRAGLRAYLLADAAILARVGVNVYPVVLKQGVTADSIVYSRASSQGDHHMQGPSGLARSRIQIDALSLVSGNAASLADLIKFRLDGASGSWAYGSDSPQRTVTVQGVFFESEREDYDDVTKLHRVSRDYFVWWSER